MPFTPFHFGPGILLKSLAQKRFSLVAFIVCQVVIDLETLIHILNREPVLHTFFHSYFGSTLAAVIAYFLTQIAFRINPWKTKNRYRPLLFSSTLFCSVLIGAWSHVLFDSIMHVDVRPFWPFDPMNPFLRMISLQDLHLGCVLSGTLGFLILAIHPVLQKFIPRSGE